MPSSARRNSPVRLPSSALIGTARASRSKCPLSQLSAARPVRLEGVGVHLLPRDPVALGQDLADPELRPEPPVDGLHERGRERARSRRGRWRPAGTRLMTSTPQAIDQVVVARRHAGGGEVDGLLGRAALAVDRRGRHGLGQPGRDPRRCGRGWCSARPTWLTQPPMTSSMRSGSTPVRSSSDVRANARRSAGCQLARAPPRLPNAVRTTSTMTGSLMCCLLDSRSTDLALGSLTRRPRLRPRPPPPRGAPSGLDRPPAPAGSPS